MLLLDFETITQAQERCLAKRLNKNISLKKLNIWFERLETTFKNDTNVLNFIKLLKLKSKTHYVKKTKIFLELHDTFFCILERVNDNGLRDRGGHFRMELKEQIIDELLKENNDYICLTNGAHIVQIIEKKEVK